MYIIYMYIASRMALDVNGVVLQVQFEHVLYFKSLTSGQCIHEHVPPPPPHTQGVAADHYVSQYHSGGERESVQSH